MAPVGCAPDQDTVMSWRPRNPLVWLTVRCTFLVSTVVLAPFWSRFVRVTVLVRSNGPRPLVPAPACAGATVTPTAAVSGDECCRCQGPHQPRSPVVDHDERLFARDTGSVQRAR